MGGHPQAETGVDDRDRSLMIIKGKRTKRQRTPSPYGIGTTASSSSTSGGGGSAGGGDCDLYPSSSSGMTVFGGADEEEEDMAYCLILLARGPGKWREEDRGLDERTEDSEFLGSSKKFSEVATNGGAMTKAGFYVYECKTCSRTFPSFQALGGHRASHKKPKLAEDPKKATLEPNSDEDIDDERRFRTIAINSPAPFASSIPNFPAKLSQPTKSKIHECSICGSEFSSGQALGGHMRRHRTVVTPAAMIADHHHSNLRTSIHGSTSRPSPVLSLDLNLPAPEDDPKFQFTSTPPQKPMLFTAPTLVDCHY